MEKITLQTTKIDKKNFFKNFKKKLFEDFKIKLICFFLAVAMYIFTSIFFQRTTVIYTVPLKIENLKDYYVVKNKLPEYIKIVAKDKSTTFNRINENDFKIRVDLNNIDRPDKYKIPIKWEIPSEMRSLFASIKIDPSELEIQVERKKEKNVRVELNTIGGSTSGYIISKVIIDPPYVRIQGPESIINSITSIKTEPINIEGIKESFTTTVKCITEYPSVKILNTTNISFEIIEEIGISTFKLSKISFLNLSEQFEARALEEITVTLKGSKSQLYNFKVSDFIFAYVDCSHIKYPGLHRLTVSIRNNSSYNLIDITPNIVDVVIEEKK